MFKKIGKTIKVVAIINLVLGIIACIVLGSVELDSYKADEALGVLLLTAGPVAAFINSILMYGFGELVEKSVEIERNTRVSKKVSAAKSNALVVTETDGLLENAGFKDELPDL